ncbi:MAG: FimV/HubP family polar landmark protein [Burkholderiales bacterium]
MRLRVGAGVLLVSTLAWLAIPALAQPGGLVPAPVASPASSSGLRSLRVSETQGAVRITVPGDSLWEIAGAAVGSSNVDRNQAMVAIVRRNPQAFPEGNLNQIQRGLSLVIPPLADMRAEDLSRAVALVAQHRQAHANRALVPVPLHALPGAASAPGLTSPPAPASASTEAAGPVAAPASAAEAGEATAAPAPPGVPWLPLGVIAALGVVAVGLLLRRGRSSEDAADRAADAELASRAFADSRLQLASQLEEELESRQLAAADDEPLYAALDDPIELADAAVPAPPALRAVGPLVWRPGQATVPVTPAAAAADEAPPPASGEALALALTLAHAYADVGRPDTARRWLQAIDARGAAPL